MSRTWTERLGLHRRELRAWALYDLANSAFITTIVTTVFPLYFVDIATFDGAMTDAEATGKLTLATTIALVIAAIVAPIAGAIGDYVPHKKKFLGTFVAIGAIATFAMYFAGPGDWRFAALVFGIANVAATGSFVFYDSLLPHIASDDEMDRVSTAGYALGYLGGAVLLCAQLAVIFKPELIGVSDRATATRLTFISVAVWWAVFTIPLLRRVPEPTLWVATGTRGFAVVGRSIAGLANTLRELKKYKQAFLFMLAFLIYNDGISTIFRMAAVYGKTALQLPSTTLIAAIIVTQLVGVPCAFAFGYLAQKIGTKRAIFTGLAVYCVVSVLGYLISTGWHFLLLAGLVGMVQGGTQALSRSLFATMIPRERSAEFFGLFAVFERFAGIGGPLVFFLVIEAFGDVRPAILAVIAFFVVGAAVLTRVDIAEGRRAARSSGTATEP